MMNNEHLLKLMQGHKALTPFDYSLAVDWAIKRTEEGQTTDAVLMLASFTKPFESCEISPYVTAVLTELGLEELDDKEAVKVKVHFHLSGIIEGVAIREHLHSLYELSFKYGYEFGIMDFYLLYHAWADIDFMGANCYFEEVDAGNIEEKLKQEAEKWIDKHIHGKEEPSEVLIQTNAVPHSSKWLWVKRWFS